MKVMVFSHCSACVKLWRKVQPIVPNTVTQPSVPSVDQRRKAGKLIRTRPAGTEMSVRKVGMILPRPTNQPP